MRNLADAAGAGRLSLRGPHPPHSVCKICGAMSDGPWVNPLLAELARRGWYAGEVTGGYLLCPAPCAVQYEAEQREKHGLPIEVPGLPAEFRSASLDNYEITRENHEAHRTARAFLDGSADLYLCGKTGAGKTRLAASILNAAVRGHGSVSFVRVPWLLVQLQEAMHASDEPAKLSDYAAPGILVLDDVGVERGTDYSRRMLTTLYDRRLDLGRRTIWTSNGDLDDLLAATGDERLVSRIAGAADVVYVGGDDRRALAAERRAANAGA